MDGDYWVNASLRPGPPYLGCVICKRGDMVANHHMVFGYASREECEEFVAQNCRSSQ